MEKKREFSPYGLKAENWCAVVHLKITFRLIQLVGKSASIAHAERFKSSATVPSSGGIGNGGFRGLLCTGADRLSLRRHKVEKHK
jgi:hypothetical protein